MFVAEIVGIGGFVPDRTVTNFDLEKMLDTTDEWIQTRTGIRERHWVTVESASDLALEAAKKALKNANVSPEGLSGILLATSTPDYQVPGTAVILQSGLGLSGIPVFELRQACAGFLYALHVGEQLIQTGAYETLLIVGVEVQSKIMDKTPRGRSISVIFADGAGAIILKRRPTRGKASESRVLGCELHADGRFARELYLPAPGTSREFGTEWLSPSVLESGQHYLQMNGKEVFVHAVHRMSEVLKSICSQHGVHLSEIDLFFFHQANLRINQKVSEDLGLAPDRVYSTIQKFGNTTAATIPLGMFDAQESGRLKKGMLCALVGFGAGFMWGGALVRY